MKIRRFVIAGVALVAMIVASCGDAAVTGGSSTSVDGGGWKQLNGGSSLYDYPSVAFTCHGTDGVYVSSFASSGATAGGDVFVVKDDPWCVSR